MLNAPLVRSAPSVAKGATLRTSFWPWHTSPRLPDGAPKRENVGSLRLLDAAAESEVHDSCLYTALAAASGAAGNSTALVGTPDTVAQALLKYYELGATQLLVRGYDPLNDARQFGEALIPKVRELVAASDRAQATEQT